GDLATGKDGRWDTFIFTPYMNGITGAPVDGAALVALGFELRDYTKTALSSGAIPLSIDLAAFNKVFNVNKLNLMFANGEVQAPVATLTTLQVIDSATGSATSATALASSATGLVVFFQPSLVAMLPVDPPSQNVVNVATGIDSAVT